MHDLSPPPAEPMDDATRSRIAARLTAASEPSSAGDRATRWLVPVGAAAAVVTVVAVVGWAAFGPDDAVPQPTGPATRTGAAEPPSPEASLEPSEPPTSQASVPGGPCAGYAARKVEAGAEVAAAALPQGTAYVFADDDRFLLCEDSAGIVTAHPVRPAAEPASLDRELLGFSSSIFEFTPRRMQGSYVAGGRLPDGVGGLSYTFPEGDVVEAEVTIDGEGRRWWIMAHVPADGPLTDPDQNRLQLDPVLVEIARGSTVDEVTLEWGRDDCTHVNRGC